MNSASVDVHELIAWDLDDYSWRSSAISENGQTFERQVEQARRRLSERDPHAVTTAVLARETEEVRHLWAALMKRADLHNEYEGLDWTLGVVDLRFLLAFQRRLIFDPTQAVPPIPRQNDWPGLVSLAMGPPRSTAYRLSHQEEAGIMSIRLDSGNPDLQLHLNPKVKNDNIFPFSLYGGSPFVEVAELYGRWFLRDGYHRAYYFLRAGVHRIPAVIIRAQTIEELGATSPWFFGKEELFSERPPRLVDFVDEAMTVRYKRAAFRKTIRIRVEETLEPIAETETQGESL